jgi:hypothetical protein
MNYAFDLIQFVIKIEWPIHLPLFKLPGRWGNGGRVLIVSTGSIGDERRGKSVVDGADNSKSMVRDGKRVEQLQPLPLILTKEKIEENAAPKRKAGNFSVEKGNE